HRLQVAPRHALPVAAFPDRRRGVPPPEERACPLRVPRAALVVADPARPCAEQRFANPVERLGRHEHDELAVHARDLTRPPSETARPHAASEGGRADTRRAARAASASTGHASSAATRTASCGSGRRRATCRRSPPTTPRACEAV